MRRAWIALVLVLAGCSSGSPSEPPATRPQLTGAQAHAGASATADALTRIPDTEASRTRLGYVAVDALGDAGLPFGAAAVERRVLGEELGAPGVTSAVRAGDDAPVLRGPGAGEEPAPETSAITPAAQSAVQSCLGDTLAQTVLGPATMGDDAAVGVGLAESGDEPAGLQLRLCGAPKYLRHIHAMERRLKARYGELDAVIEEREIGEREIVAAVVAVRELPARHVLGLLEGGRELRAVAFTKR